MILYAGIWTYHVQFHISGKDENTIIHTQSKFTCGLNISTNAVGEIKFFSLQKAICRIKNKVYHKSNGHIFITCTKYLTKSEWLYSWKTLLLTRLKPSEKLVRGIVASVKIHQSLNKYKISVRNNDGNRQLDQFRHNGKIILLSHYTNTMKNYGVYSTGHYKYGSPGVAATNCCVYINTLLQDT